MERVEYNKQNEAMQSMVSDAIDMSATILKDTQKHREENEKLNRQIKKEKEEYEATLAAFKREETIKLDDLWQ